MTADEAIEVLGKYRQEHHSYGTDIIGKAEQLGIEALKREVKRRKQMSFHPDDFYPGETEE